MGDYPFVLPSGGVALPVSVANGGTGQATAAAGYSALSPMTTAGDMEYEVAAGTAARLPVGSAGQLLGVSGGEPAWGMGLTLLATTGLTGFALINGTGTILTWTAPSDGNLHRVLLFGASAVTVTEVGGGIGVHYTDVTGTAQDQSLLSPSLGTGQQPFNSAARQLLMIKAGVTVSIVQDTALTSGAATLYAEIWGS